MQAEKNDLELAIKEGGHKMGREHMPATVKDVICTRSRIVQRLFKNTSKTVCAEWFCSDFMRPDRERPDVKRALDFFMLRW